MKQLRVPFSLLIFLCTTIHVHATDHSTVQEKEPVHEFSPISVAALAGGFGAIIGAASIAAAKENFFNKKESPGIVIIKFILNFGPSLGMSIALPGILTDLSIKTAEISSIAYTVGFITYCIYGICYLNTCPDTYLRN